jgi:hypothetical protein
MSNSKQLGTLTGLAVAVLLCCAASFDAKWMNHACPPLCGFSRALRIVKTIEELENNALSEAGRLVRSAALECHRGSEEDLL